jgi:hypothetical protein
MSAVRSRPTAVGQRIGNRMLHSVMDTLSVTVMHTGKVVRYERDRVERH